MSEISDVLESGEVLVVSRVSNDLHTSDRPTAVSTQIRSLKPIIPPVLGSRDPYLGPVTAFIDYASLLGALGAGRDTCSTIFWKHHTSLWRINVSYPQEPVVFEKHEENIGQCRRIVHRRIG